MDLDQLRVHFFWSRDYVLFRLDKIRTHRARAMEKAIFNFCYFTELTIKAGVENPAAHYCEATARLRKVKADLTGK